MRALLIAGAGVAMTTTPVVVGVGSAAAGGSAEHFSFMTDSTNQSDVVYSAIATGEFTDGGTATMSGKTLTIQLAAGTIAFAIKKGHHNVAEGPGCVQHQTSSGAYSITGGTGAYKSISGSGTTSVSVTFVESASGSSCSSVPTAAQAIIIAGEPVSLGS